MHGSTILLFIFLLPLKRVVGKTPVPFHDTEHQTATQHSETSPRMWRKLFSKFIISHQVTFLLPATPTQISKYLKLFLLLLEFDTKSYKNTETSEKFQIFSELITIKGNGFCLIKRIITATS